MSTTPHTEPPTRLRLALPPLPPLSVRAKLILPFCLIGLMIVTTLWLLARTALLESAQRHANQLGSTVTVQTADAVTELVLANDLLSLNVILNQLTRSSGIARAVLYDIDDRVIVAAGSLPDTIPAGLSLNYSAPVALQDSIAGRLEVTLSPTAIKADTQQLFNRYLLVLLASLVFFAVAAHALYQHLIRPLRQLKQALDTTDENLIHIAPGRADDISDLQFSGLHFLEQYRLELNELYGTPEARAGQELLASQSQCTLLCVSVAGLQTLMPLMHPATVTALLDEYFLLLARASRYYGGRLLHFKGDSLLIAFDHQQIRRPVKHAMYCARLFLRLLALTHEQQRQQGSPVFDFVCAIHSGDVLVSHLGAGDQVNEGLLGDTVIAVSTLCAQGRAGEVRLSGSSARLAGGKQSSQLVPVPGEHGATEHFILGPAPAAVASLLEQQAEQLLRGPHPYKTTARQAQHG